MKYLLIFLPIFAFAQDTIAFLDGDTIIYGNATYGSGVEVKSVYGTTYIDTCWQIKDGYMSLKPGCVFNSHVKYRGISPFQELYPEDRSFELIDSFRHNGDYYELRSNGWYKQIIPDTIPENIKIKGDTLFRWIENPWIPCNQQFGEVDHPKRDKIEQSEVILLVWTGCALAEWRATKFIGYNYSDNSFWVDDTIRVKDLIVWYLAGGKWIKSSHVIKEL